MTELNRVIYDIERCISHELGSCPACSKYNKEGIKPGHCTDYLLADALELLKSQPDIVRCENCKNWIAGYITDQDEFIPPKCGKYQQMVGHSSDDFCSLAERR